MTDRPISVVIPAYQAAATVVEAVTSVLDQRPSPFAVIVVDDGSTDGTAAALDPFGSAITVVSQPNGGEAAARNTGLAAVHTEWVAYLDADDRFLPGRLDAMVRRIDADPTVDIVTTDAFLQIDGRIAGTAYGPQWPFPDGDQRTEILRRNFVFGHVLARAADLRAAGGFDESISHTTDWAMWLRLILEGRKFVGHVARPLSIYRLHASSSSADRLAMAVGGLASLRTAVGHPALTGRERAVLDASVRRQEGLIAREELSAALDAEQAQLRRHAVAVVRGREQPRRARAKAVVIAACPSVVAGVVKHRRRRAPIGTLGRSVPAVARAPEAATRPPLASVVVAIGQDRDDLARSVASVRAQHCGAWELLLVDRSTTGRHARSDAIDAACADPLRVRFLPLGAEPMEVAEAPTAVVLAAGDELPPGAIERRLRMLARCSEAGVVIDIGSDASPGDPVILSAGCYPALLLAGRAAMPPAAAALFSVDARRALPSSLAAEMTDPLAFVAIGLRHPVVLGGPLVDGSRNVVDIDLELWVFRHAWVCGRRGWALVAAVAARRALRSAIALSQCATRWRSRRGHAQRRGDAATGGGRRASTPADRRS